ncbi:hydantoinase/oxoprolinase family protein [Paraburkholderia sp. LEh10]|uniref:hydantoinase/oxoprolinase family protein n=1 Tax=Paraburkholderia sp. LEh10 TaxID=2821353 RepID=UPI001AE0F16E|nr:hydantoinase/oxoprolinase family protein [Paraburkholderia sp. LEh10]MBP0593791.1 hydantoinase/oxoprolinase family protein [Paraburkholderia sp. LEh10]
MSYRVGVDIGGSFTDFAVLNEDTREIKSLKVFSRPDQPGAEVLAGISALGERYGVEPKDIAYFTHGTTVGINTVIQRKGLRLALFTNEHFCDVLELARLKIPDMYNLLSKRPAPLIERDMVFGIPGRIDARGNELTPLDEEALAQALRRAVASGAQGIVISFLHSYTNPEHEIQAKAFLEKARPGFPVFRSSETWPIIREYERTITAVVGGYVQPRVAHYLEALQYALKDAGVSAEAHLTKTNGGIMTAEQGKRDCVQMILSGTASGVIGASYVAETSNIAHCMSLDIGGTSADVALIENGQPQYGVGEKIGDFNIHIPSVSVTSIGEGGGSIAWIDEYGVLKVGPDSAGSRPGPACYGMGGTRATITDAFVACGLVGHSQLGYNAVNVDRAKARDAVGELASQLGRSIEETAEAIIRIAISGMYADVSALVSRFGIDVTEYALLAFGGAGPMMACFLARELKMPETLVPPTPGVLSALGGLIADLKNDFIKTVYADLRPEISQNLAVEFKKLREEALHWLKTDQGYNGKPTFVFSAEMRYRGQSFEIDTELDPSLVEHCDADALAAAFHAAHRRMYGHADDSAAVQVITLRLVAIGKTDKPQFPRRELNVATPNPVGTVTCHLDGEIREIGLYRRASLEPGHHFDGPAVIAQDDCTTVVPPGFRVNVDEFSNLRIVLENTR